MDDYIHKIDLIWQTAIQMKQNINNRVLSDKRSSVDKRLQQRDMSPGGHYWD